MQIIKTLVLIITFLINQNLFSQVINDNIEDRITLEINKSHFSKTDDCTLQPSCLNRDIEHKCITYHNDQWFDFSVSEAKNYYINISSQSCKDIDGVQLVVIDGAPCEPESYTSLGCVSLGTQDDIYLSLGALKLNHNYLILVDGYLEDYCKFEIELSDIPKGNPRRNKPAPNLNYKLSKNVVNFAWSVNNDNASNYEEYHIYRRESREHKSTLLGTLNHEKDSYGKNKLVYSSSDTLQNTGLFYYDVYANLKVGGKELIGSLKVDFDLKEVQNKYSKYNLNLSRTFKKSTPIEILITDAITDRIIISDYRDASRDHQLMYNLKPALDLGITKIKIAIKNQRKDKTEVFEIDWTQYLKE